MRRQALLSLERDRGGQHRRKRCAQLMAEHGEKLILREIGACLFLQLFVRLLQLCRQGLRLFEQIFRSRVCFDGMEHNADALCQLIEKRLIRRVEALERREFYDCFYFSLEQDRQNNNVHRT